jgi:hypothetical protein
VDGEGEMLEVIKTLGSYIGLLTGLVVLYDRMAKGRPVASLTIGEENGRPSPRIRVSNPSPYDIAILDVTVNRRFI